MRNSIEEIKKLLPIPNLEKARKVLCIQPHPDDTDIGAGATIAKLCKKGVEVYYLSSTSDSIGTSDKALVGEKITKIRKEEQQRAADVLGVKEVIWLDYPDAGNYSMYDLRNDLVKWIRKIKPDFIMTVDPWLPYEAHRDHVKTGLAASEAVLLYGFPGVVPEIEIEEGFEIKGIAFFHTAYPNTVIDVDDTWKLKFEAIKQHESQIDEKTLDLFKRYFDLKAREYAKDKLFTYGEVFKVLSPVFLHCFVDAWRM
ncbi:MAG: PIG-L family deacetylase [Thermotoga sp.]|nr:MAG: PIG-L family deacetylase [Thermotoga sp.]